MWGWWSWAPVMLNWCVWHRRYTSTHERTICWSTSHARPNWEAPRGSRLAIRSIRVRKFQLRRYQTCAPLYIRDASSKYSASVASAPCGTPKSPKYSGHTWHREISTGLMYFHRQSAGIPKFVANSWGHAHFAPESFARSLSGQAVHHRRHRFDRRTLLPERFHVGVS